jgi:hypothetical protein
MLEDIKEMNKKKMDTEWKLVISSKACVYCITTPIEYRKGEDGRQEYKVNGKWTKEHPKFIDNHYQCAFKIDLNKYSPIIKGRPVEAKSTECKEELCPFAVVEEHCEEARCFIPKETANKN